MDYVQAVCVCVCVCVCVFVTLTSGSLREGSLACNGLNFEPRTNISTSMMNIIFISTFGSLTCMTLALAINLARNSLDALLKILNLEYIW